MMELPRRVWWAFWYDPMVEYQRAKDLLARRITTAEAGPDDRSGELPKSK